MRAWPAGGVPRPGRGWLRWLPGLLLGLALPAVGRAARPWPDTRSRIVPFADQLPDGMSAAQRQFAATRFAGTQKMRRSEIRALRIYNPNFLCLHYQLGVGAGPAEFIIGDAWGSDWAFVNAQAGWFLRNASGRRIHQTQWNWDVMDIRYAGGRPVTGFPDYWISQCLARIRAAENDGVFADSFMPDAYGFGQSSPAHPWLEDPGQCLANWVPSLEKFGRECRAALRAAGFRFLPNLGALITGWLNVDYGLGDGGMIESFAFWGPGDYFDAADWALQVDRALALTRAGRILICQSYPEAGNARERMFATASYLLIKDRATYLNLLATDDVALEYYPEYMIDLGAARGAVPAGAGALWHAGWGVYRRDFANGIVLVNPGARTVTIPNLGATYRQVIPRGGGVVDESGRHGGSLAYTSVRSLTLPAHSGAVLLRPASVYAWDAYEADNRSTRARRIANRRIQTRSIHAPGNVDWVKFKIYRNGARGVDLMTRGDAGDTEMWLYGSRSGGTAASGRIAYNDDRGANPFARIRLSGLATGTYFLKIQEKGNNGTISNYTLRARWVSTPPPADAYESDNRVSTAKTIANGRTQRRSIHAPGNRDWVCFTIGGRGARNLAVQTAGTSGDTQMWVCDRAGNRLAYDDDSGPGRFSRITAPFVPPGTYTIRIQEKGNNGVIPAYTLRTTWTQR